MLLDAAHNPAGAAALASYLKEQAGDEGRRSCFRRCATRTSTPCLRALLPVVSRARRDARVESARRRAVGARRAGARDRAGAAGRDRAVAAGRRRRRVAVVAADRRRRIDFSPRRRDAGDARIASRGRDTLRERLAGSCQQGCHDFFHHSCAASRFSSAPCRARASAAGLPEHVQLEPREDRREPLAARRRRRARARRHQDLRRRSRAVSRREPRGRDRQRALHAGREPDRGRSRRLQHRDAARHLLQRARHRQRAAAQAAAARGRRRAAADRRPGQRRLLLRRDGREDRTEEIQDRQRRLQHVRPADAALEPDGGHGHPEHRSLHDPEGAHAHGEGRAAALSAVPALLPDEERGSRDRLPHPDLRHRRRCGASRSTTRSSGRSTAARTRRSSTSSIPRSARASAANTATTTAASTPAT